MCFGTSVCVSGGWILVTLLVKVVVLVKVVLSNTWAEVSSSSGCCSSRVARPTGERTDNNLNRYQPGAQLEPRSNIGRLEAGEAFLTNGRPGERGEPGAGRPAS